MGFLIRRIIVSSLAAFLFIAAFRQLGHVDEFPLPNATNDRRIRGPLDWRKIPIHFPVTSPIPLPTEAPLSLPRIQHVFGVETEHNKAERLQRLAAVKETFLYTWNGYKKYAWMQDEITPVTGGYRNPFGQRAATLVDALDTLIIMELDEEVQLALTAVKKIDFSTSMERTMSVFETTIRYLGGLLGAYDLSDGAHHVLLEKATQLGDMLYAAFDTPNRLPIVHWDWAQ